ncbi:MULTISPECIES: hypothetical protein [Streptomyces]|uniref:hypothetical protein n=1 Tax=Streptomyces TaxID=1883 RepID=UPI001E5AB410|nr:MULTISPECIES: hypothetical protein [Streptomyces]UFQ16867.1 hypothetical protein J2N69_18720 [Streptomyces huasconensis]WCL86470.1 hypothetical protein PPN52_18725 [Streptomyces sp. JCM 35825]
MIYDDAGALQEEQEVSTRAGQLRLLTWHGPNGNRCYLSTDDEAHSTVARLANDIEEAQTATAEKLLEAAKEVLSDPRADAQVLRFALSRVSEALADVLLVAESRGERLPGLRCGKARDEPEEKDPTLPVEPF